MSAAPDTGGERLLDGPGTPEQVWRAPGALDGLGWVDAAAAPPPGRLVVVAPHPDDEVLGAGGALAVWAAAGVAVTVVAVTDGEGSHPHSPTLGPAVLADRRAGERRRALERLGLDPARVHRLQHPDGAVAGHVDAVAAELAHLLGPGDTCLAPVPGDGHPDHDATAVAAARAVAATGAAGWSYPVWLWHHVRPGDPVDRPGGWAGARRIGLPAWAARAKDEAVACFTTQVAPLSADPRDAAVLPPAVLARFARGFEVLWGPV